MSEPQTEPVLLRAARFWLNGTTFTATGDTEVDQKLGELASDGTEIIRAYVEAMDRWEAFLGLFIADLGEGTEPYRFRFSGPGRRGLSSWHTAATWDESVKMFHEVWLGKSP